MVGAWGHHPPPASLYQPRPLLDGDGSWGFELGWFALPRDKEPSGSGSELGTPEDARAFSAIPVAQRACQRIR